MINLLPAKQKKELLLGYVQKRLFSLLSGCFFSFSLFLITLFFMGDIFVAKQESLKDIIIKKQKIFQATYVEDLKTSMEQSTKQLEVGKGLWEKEILLTPFFEKLSLVAPDSIYFTNLMAKLTIQDEIKLKEGNTNRNFGETYFNVNMTGFSPNREMLYAFNRSLQQEQGFQAVNFAISSWMSALDVDFALSLEFPALVSAQVK